MKWVQCDKCLKWRRIPASISDRELEGEWECKMNKWDLKRNSCLAEEENYDLAEEQTVNVSNTDQSKILEKQQEFYGILQRFYRREIKQKNLRIEQLKQAMIGDKNIDFHQLYLEVTKRGGYHYCIQNKLFNQVFVSLQCFQAQQTKYANSILQQLYSKYLYDYEQKYFQQNQSKSPSNQPFMTENIHHSPHNKSHNLHSNF